MPDMNTIPAPPSGSIVDTDPLNGSIPPPPSGSIVDADPGASLDLSNSQGQGTYQMSQNGKTVAVPYGQVQHAAQQGYQFASDQDRFRFNKDSSADPNFKQVYTAAPNESTPQGHLQAVRAREAATPAAGLGQTAVGVMKGAGTLLKPVDDALSVADGNNEPNNYTTATNGYQEAGKIGTIAASALPAAVEAPVAAAAGLGTGVVSAKVGQILGEHLGLNEKQTALLSDLFAVAGGLGGAKGASAIQSALTGGEAGAEGSGVANAEKPGIIQQLIKGEDVNQPMAQGAVRSAVQQSAEGAGTANDSLVSDIQNKPILENDSTILDDHLSALRQQEKAAYRAVDDTVGFDLKQEKAQLSNDQYKLSQLGNTESDINQRGNLIEAINDSTDRIAEAESKLKDAGIDPKEADAIHQQRMAGMQFKKALVQNTNPDGSVNVDGLLNASKKLRFDPKYGDRLTQFFGSKQTADDYMAKLMDAQNAGIAAMKARSILKWTAIGLGIGGGAISGVEKFLK